METADVAGGRNEGHTVFRRCSAPEKIEIVRTEGNNSLLCFKFFNHKAGRTDYLGHRLKNA